MSNVLSHELRELRREAKRLVKAANARDASALARIVEHHPRFRSAKDVGPIKLADAQLVLAREKGHATWSELKRDYERRSFVGQTREARVLALVDAICGRGWDGAPITNLNRAEEYLKADPRLAQEDFVVACVTGEVEVVRARLHAEPELATRELAPRGWQPLVYVAFSTLARLHDERADRITRVGRLLLEHGASPNAHYLTPGVEDHTFPALLGCIDVSDNLTLAEALLDAGADPNDNQSLYHAAQRFDLTALELLYRYGLEPRWLSYCMLHKIDFGHVDGVRWFLDHGADPNVMHPGGHRALHWAIMRPGPRAMALMLLERGANPNERTRAGYTALDLAERWHGRVNLVPELERHGAERSPRSALDELVVAAANGDQTRARVLLDENPELINNLAEENRSLVPAFAETGNAVGAACLLRLGFDGTATSWEGMTAVGWAACHGSPSMLRELMAAGAPLLVDGTPSPLYIALHRQWFREGPGENDYAGIVRMLLAAGVPVPDDLKPCGKPELDALIEQARRSPPAVSV